MDRFNIRAKLELEVGLLPLFRSGYRIIDPLVFAVSFAYQDYPGH